MMRGIRQGCAVPALLFILSVEFMAIQIRQNDIIKGIAVGTFESKILQYADDTTLTLQCNTSVSLGINEIHNFSKVSGLNLNLSKSLGPWLALLNLSPLMFEGISFTNEPIECLGIYVVKHKTVCLENMWEEKLQFEKILNIWNTRKLTYFGKIVVNNSLVIPIYNTLHDHSVHARGLHRQLGKLIFDFYGENIIRLKMYCFWTPPKLGYKHYKY